MNIGNVLGVISLVLLAIYALGAKAPPGAVIANLRGISLLLILPLSLIAGWKGSRLWWILSAVFVALVIIFFVALSKHS